MRITADSYFLMAIIATSLVAIFSLLGMEQFYAKLVPFILSSAVFVLASVALLKNMASRGRTGLAVDQDDINGRKEAKGSLRGYVAAGLWTISFFSGIYLLGLIIAIGLFVFSYTKSHGTSWLMSIILTVSTLAFAYGIFEVGLSIPLYKGLLFIWLGY